VGISGVGGRGRRPCHPAPPLTPGPSGRYLPGQGLCACAGDALGDAALRRDPNDRP
jgi:hypothetical protein